MLLAGENMDKEDTEEEKEPTTEDELLRDREDTTDTVFKDNNDDDDDEEEDDDEEVRVVDLGTEPMQPGSSLPDTPRLLPPRHAHVGG